MVTFEGISNINEVLYLKGRQVYINEDDLKLDEDEFLSFKLIGFDVIINNKIVGKVEEIIDTPANEVLKVGKILIPYVKDFVNKIDEDNKTIYINDIGGLL
jgi:16S rRNA processing protein RimM